MKEKSRIDINMKENMGKTNKKPDIELDFFEVGNSPSNEKSGRKSRAVNMNNKKNNKENKNEKKENKKDNMKENKKDSKIKRDKKTNAEMIKVTYLFLAVFIGMIAYFVNFQVNQSDDVINNSYNKRQGILENEVVRGDILSDDGQVLATTVTDENGNEVRQYPFGNLFAHVVGYPTHGAFGIESLANYKLLTSDVNMLQLAINDIMGKKDPGNSVTTSLNVWLTKTAYEALGDYQGAVVAIEPKTGKILTMVSKPDFDPNQIDAIWDELVSDDTKSNLVNRATSGRYTPGSTFKMMTLLEFVHENPNYLQYGYECKGEITIDGNTVRCAGGNWHGWEDLRSSFANSCNSSFVNMGMSLDKTRFKQLCNSLLFNRELPIKFTYNKSSFVLDENSTSFETMQTSIGQGKTTVSPIHLAMLASAVCNNGTLMKPYVVTDVKNADGVTVKKYSPEKYDTLFSAEDLAVLRDYMRAVVTEGTGYKLNSENYTAYGKTGTAQVADGERNNSLFMGFAENGTKSIAICVVMENMPEGSTYAVPIAKSVLETYFSY